MSDKKEENEKEEKEEGFTGSPEQQFPDMEAEETHDPRKGLSGKEKDTDKRNKE